MDFLALAARGSLDKALQRLVLAGELRRIDRGLYDRPRVNSLTAQQTVPDHRAVIDAIARRDQARVLIDGLTAANDLGLTTATPARVVVLTDARIRPINLGNLQLRFKTVAPSRLYWAGRPAMRIVQALHWSHDMLATDRERIVARLVVILSDQVYGQSLRADLCAGLHTLPTWMHAVVRDSLSASTPGGHSNIGGSLQTDEHQTAAVTAKRHPTRKNTEHVETTVRRIGRVGT